MRQHLGERAVLAPLLSLTEMANSCASAINAVARIVVAIIISTSENPASDLLDLYFANAIHRNSFGYSCSCVSVNAGASPAMRARDSYRPYRCAPIRPARIQSSLTPRTTLSDRDSATGPSLFGRVRGFLSVSPERKVAKRTR